MVSSPTQTLKRQVAFVISGILFALSPALAVEPVENVHEKLGKCEHLLFGSTNSEQPDEDRLRSIEKRLFGKKKKGEFDKRLNSALAVLLLKHPPESKANSCGATEPPQERSNANADAASSAAAEKVSESAPKDTAATPNQQQSMSSKPSASDTVNDAGEAKEASSREWWKQAGQGSERAAESPALSKGGTSGPLGSLQQPLLKSQTPKLDRLSPETAATNNDSGLQDKERQALKEGMAAYARNDAATAELLFKEVIMMNSRNADAFYNLGAIAEGKRDYIGALTNYRSALQIKPGDGEVQKAVTAVEQLMAQQRLSRTQNHNRIGRPENSSADPYPPLAPAIVRQGVQANGGVPFSEPPPPDADDHSYPVLNAASGHTGSLPVSGGSLNKPFELSSTKNNALQNAQNNVVNGNAQQVVQKPRSPVMNVAARTALGVLISVGSSYALRGTGLHCPACRIFSNGQILRTGLRGLFR